VTADAADATVTAAWTGPAGDRRRYRVELIDGAPIALGDGAEGLVFRATEIDDNGERAVALKLLTRVAPADFATIAARAALLAEVHDPHLMQQRATFVGGALSASDDGDADDVLYSVATWVPGEPMTRAVQHVTTDRALSCVAQLATAVAALHEFRAPGAPDGLVHRDVKPSNVRIDPDGDAVLIDFGLARPHVADDLTAGAGTHAWRAPEVIGGPGTPGPASDVWGVGAVAAWVLTGEPPRLEGAGAARERLVVAAEHAGFANAPELAAHVAALLESDPDDRPTDLRAWGAELDALVGRRTRAAWYRRAVPLAGVAAIVGVVVGAALGITVLAPDGSDATGRPSGAVKLGAPFAVPEARPDELVRKASVMVRHDGAPVILAADADGTEPFLVNDDLTIRVTHPDGSEADPYHHNFGESSNCAVDLPQDPVDLTAMFAPGVNTVTFEIRDGCRGGHVGKGGFAGLGTPLWLRYDR
jgi:hypothetical protein